MLVHLNIYKESKDTITDTVDTLNRIGYTDIVCRFDGVFNREIIESLLDKGVHVYLGKNLKQINKGGLPTHNYFRIWLSDFPDYSWYMKVDPDTKPIRKIDTYPRYIGCNYNTATGCIYGGCILLSHEAVSTIYHSNYLLDEKYRTQDYRYYKKEGKLWLSCQDLIIYNVISRLGIPIDYLETELLILTEQEARDNRRVSLVDSLESYAFIHPKQIWQRVNHQ